MIRFILNNEDIKTVLDSEADSLRQLMIDAKAPCWLPDADSNWTRMKNLPAWRSSNCLLSITFAS